MNRRQLLKDWAKDFFVIDWETYYDKDCTIKGTTTVEYCKHPKFDPYLVALCWGDEEHERYSGRPQDFDWSIVEGKTAVAHNRGFDYPVTLRAIEMGYMPDIEIKGWHDTSAMAGYLQLGRSLADSMRGTFGEEMSKEVRDYMKGKTWQMIVDDGKADDVINYAITDAILEWRLFKELYPRIPQEELDLEDLTIKMGLRGLPIDTGMVEEAIDNLEKKMWECRNALPWYNEIDPDTRKPYVIYSKKALAIECRRRGIKPPKSLAQGSEEAKEWFDKHKGEMSFVADMQNYQRMNTHLKKLKTMSSRVNLEGRMPYSLMYFGAEVTGRWSGAGGFNVQNLPRDTKYGVNIRNCIKAPEGKIFIVSDLSQIEARLIWKCVGDEAALDLVREGYNPYEAHAIATMGWTGGKLKDEDPDLYLLAKTRVLQLGYGCGWYKFYETVRSFGQLHILEGEYGIGDKRRFTNFLESYQEKYLNWFNAADAETKTHWVNAFIQVMDYRDKNPLIVNKWKEYDREYKSKNDGGDMSIELFNGREIHFWNIRVDKGNNEAKLTKGGARRGKYYGANLFQNEVQGNARNLFGNHMLEINKAGYDIVLQVHDEVVVEVDIDKAQEVKKEIRKIMKTAPEWCDVPLDSDVVIMDRYTK
jgi:hypothetical protein